MESESLEICQIAELQGKGFQSVIFKEQHTERDRFKDIPQGSDFVVTEI